jgi:hypothetical protein
MKDYIAVFAVTGIGLITAPGFALAQNTGPAMQDYSCPAGYKIVAKVCLAPDQQHATCLFPETVGGTRKSGDLQDANPAACPSSSWFRTFALDQVRAQFWS